MPMNNKINRRHFLKSFQCLMNVKISTEDVRLSAFTSANGIISKEKTEGEFFVFQVLLEH